MNVPSLKVSFGNKQEIDTILDDLKECLETGMVSQGKYCDLLEEKVKEISGAKHAIAVNSGSSAIEAVMRNLNVEGKEVLVPTNTFLATASGVIFAGGKVKLMDVDPETFGVTLDEVKKRATKDTVGVIVVHIGGIVTPEIREIKNWCDENGIWLFEDAAHAIGCDYDGQQAGTFGIAGSYSLFATKVINSGEGGVIVTNDDDIAAKVRLFCNHGKPEPWVTYHTAVGANYRMSDITGAIALSQVNRLEKIIVRRQRIADKYTELLLEKNSNLKIVQPKGKSNWYKYIIILPEGKNRDDIKTEMKKRGIGLQGEVYGIPLHRQPIAKQIGFIGEFPNADDVCSRHICLPLYPELTDEQIHYVVDTLFDVMEEK